MTFAGITQRVVRGFDSRWRHIFFCSSPTLQSTISLLLQSKEDWDNLFLLSTSCPYKFRVVSAWLFSSSFLFLQVEHRWSGSSMRCISTHEIETLSNECLTVLLRARTGYNKQIKTVCSIAFFIAWFTTSTTHNLWMEVMEGWWLLHRFVFKETLNVQDVTLFLKFYLFLPRTTISKSFSRTCRVKMLWRTFTKWVVELINIDQRVFP